MRYDLTDFEWSVIEPFLPMDRRGSKPKNNRQVLNGIFWGSASRGAMAPTCLSDIDTVDGSSQWRAEPR